MKRRAQLKQEHGRTRGPRIDTSDFRVLVLLVSAFSGACIAQGDPAGEASPERIATPTDPVGTAIAVGPEAITPPPPQWLQLCDLPPGPLSDIAAAEVMLLQPQFIHSNGDGTSRIDTRPWVNVFDFSGNPLPLDPDSIFYGDPQMLAGRSGVMIGPDLVLSASHVNPLDPTQWRVIRGLGSHATASGCQEADFAHVPDANIFTPQLPVVVNTYGSATSGLQPDYIAFHLDRPTGGPYLRIRRSGAAQVGDHAIEIDHANRFSTRVSPDATLYGTDPTTNALLVNGVYALDGSSGGMIYNLDSGYVEGVQANGGGCAWFTINAGGDYKLTEQCTSYPASPNRQIVDVAAQFPAYSLVTNPVDRVVHVAAVNAAPTLPTTTYTITAPTTTSGSSAWQLVPPASIAGEPGLVFAPATTSGSLAPGAVQSFTVTATPGTQCGTYTKAFSIIDTARGFTDQISHRFEIGMTEYTVSPATDFSTEGMLPPYDGTVYTLTNPRPTPVTVRVAPPSFVTISVVQGTRATVPSSAAVDVVLGPVGSSTATARIGVAFLLPYSLVPTEHVTLRGDLTFTNQAHTCEVTSVVTRHIQITPGQETFEQIGPETSPLGPPAGSVYGPPLTSSQTIAEDFIIDSVALDVVFWDWPLDWVTDDLAATKVVLVSPAGVEYVVWDRNVVTNPASLTYENLDIGGDAEAFGVLHISDTAAPSPVGTLLASLNGQDSVGTWQVAVYSTGAWNVFMDWSLHFTGHAPAPPACGVDWLPPCTSTSVSGTERKPGRRTAAGPRAIQRTAHR